MPKEDAHPHSDDYILAKRSTAGVVPGCAGRLAKQ